MEFHQLVYFLAAVFSLVSVSVNADGWPKMKQLFDDAYWTKYCSKMEVIETKKELKKLYLEDESWAVGGKNGETNLCDEEPKCKTDIPDNWADPTDFNSAKCSHFRIFFQPFLTVGGKTVRQWTKGKKRLCYQKETAGDRQLVLGRFSVIQSMDLKYKVNKAAKDVLAANLKSTDVKVQEAAQKKVKKFGEEFAAFFYKRSSSPFKVLSLGQKDFRTSTKYWSAIKNDLMVLCYASRVRQGYCQSVPQAFIRFVFDKSETFARPKKGQQLPGNFVGAYFSPDPAKKLFPSVTAREVCMAVKVAGLKLCVPEDESECDGMTQAFALPSCQPPTQSNVCPNSGGNKLVERVRFGQASLRANSG